jgi:hypothetical protein
LDQMKPPLREENDRVPEAGLVAQNGAHFGILTRNLI